MKTYQIQLLSRWRLAKPATRLFWRAIFYGIASAAFAGAVIGFAYDLSWNGRILNIYLARGFALIGFIYGLVAAPIFAFVMKALAVNFYGASGDYGTGNPVRFKVVMGGLR